MSFDTPVEAIKQHFGAINARDPTAYVATMAFPFTYQNYDGVALTIASGADCGTRSGPFPWDIILRTDPQWSHSEFTDIHELARTQHSAAYRVSFVRVDDQRDRSAVYDAIWIAVHNKDGWHVMYRHNMGLRL